MNPIKSFEVNGLFKSTNVFIPFDNNPKILIGENGIGKTQVLNMFYFVLTKSFTKLTEFEFDNIILEFSNETRIELSSEKILDDRKKNYSHPLIQDLIKEIGYEKFQQIYANYIGSHGNRRILEMEFQRNPNLRKYSLMQLSRAFEQTTMTKSDSNSLFQDETFAEEYEIINSALGESEILYFPTYRRVEEDLHALGYDDNDDSLHQENSLIQFGMDDVQKRFNQVENTIDKYLKDGFSQITSEILSQLVRGFSDVDRSFLNRIDIKDIEIILSRVGNQLTEDDKNKIRLIVTNKEEKNQSLMYFLKKLVEIYERQKTIDDSVKIFRDICNRYLVNKQVFYDESEIKLFIQFQGGDEKQIKLSKLSSGEKQIVSIFSKIYLSDINKKYIVLFDEPELSLSMTWQKNLLPDVIKSNKCNFMLAVTHSPFIFDNELDNYAIGLAEYMKRKDTNGNQNELY